MSSTSYISITPSLHVGEHAAFSTYVKTDDIATAVKFIASGFTVLVPRLDLAVPILTQFGLSEEEADRTGKRATREWPFDDAPSGDAARGYIPCYGDDDEDEETSGWS